MSRPHVFVTGGTGYIGRPLLARLRARGHTVRALVRSQSQAKLAPEVHAVVGDALDPITFQAAIAPADTLVHLVGTPHPSPRKAQAFRDVDLASIRAAVAAANFAGVKHLVYVSVAQPAPVMREYVAVRAAGEALIAASGLRATFVRPWYVLGPSHRWPLLLTPLYALLERIPSTRDTARRLGLVRLEQMVTTLAWAVENVPQSTRVIDVAAIRETSLAPV